MQDADVVGVIAIKVFELEFGDGMRRTGDEQCSLGLAAQARRIGRAEFRPASACARPAEPA